MKANIGGIDRIIRIVIGLALIAVAIFVPGAWWGWIGVVPLLTAFIRFCPLYPLFKINTCKK